MKKEDLEQKKVSDNKIRFSIRKKILLLSLMAAVPFLIVSVFLLTAVARYNHTYDEIVNNLAVANNYNLNFKEEIDESLYKIVVGYTTFDRISKDDTLQNPYVLIDDLRTKFTGLKEITTDSESKAWLEILLRNTETLEKRVNDIVKNVENGAQYEKNLEELDKNIYILTELIQDDIQYYIYHQTRSMDVVTTKLDQQIEVFIIVCALLLVTLILVIILAMLHVTSSILHPIEELYKAAGKIAEGDFGVQVNASSRDELAVLVQGFNNMAGNIQVLVDKVKEDEQKMRRADLRLLQEQINPHFLYNTLDNIVWLIEGNEPEQAVEMVVTLSDFFRVVLSKGKEFISIKQEERHIRSYLEIQGKRYHDILEYDIRIDPVLYEYQILKLTLQPLVENSLYHGIKYKRSKGYIHIYGEKRGDAIYLTVQDDGVGMDAEELEQLREQIGRPCQETEKGFGLANVNERIHMYFGDEYGMTIDSEKGKGTTVEIVIPAIETGMQEERTKG